MADTHWGDDDFLARLYGIGPEDAHLGTCEECRARWESLQLRREQLCSPESQVSQEFLARQRRSIYERLEGKSRRFHLRPAPTLATLLLILVIATLFRPSLQREPMDTISDVGVFEEAFEIASSSEPSAIEPVQSLFEVRQ